MDLEHKRVTDLFEVKFSLKGHDVEIYFFVQETECNMLFTAGYFNIEALQKVFLEVTSVVEKVSFIGIISGDDRETVKQCAKKTIKAVKRRVRSFIEGGRSIRNINTMTIEEIYKKFFSNNSTEQSDKKSKTRILRDSQSRNELVDLTIAEEENSNDKQSVRSTIYFEQCCSDVLSSSGSSCILVKNEDLCKKFLQPPTDSYLLDSFIKQVDKDLIIDPDEYQAETRSLEEMKLEFIALEEKVKRKLESEPEEKGMEAKTPKKFRDDSNVSRCSTSRSPLSDFRRSLFSHHKEKFTDSQKTSLVLPQLGRGIDLKEGVKLGDPIEIVLDSDDYKSSTKLPKFSQSFISFSLPVQTNPSPSKFTIPKKRSTSPKFHQQNPPVIEKSPVSSVKARSPINNRIYHQSPDSHRGMKMLQLALKGSTEGISSPNQHNPQERAVSIDRRSTPASVSDFIDKPKENEDVLEIIDLDDNDDEKNNNETKHRKRAFYNPEPNKIFTSKKPRSRNRSPNGPNFGNFDGSSRR